MQISPLFADQELKDVRSGSLYPSLLIMDLTDESKNEKKAKPLQSLRSVACVNQLTSQEIVINRFLDIRLSLQGFEKAFEGAWSIYGTEEDDDPLIKMSFFNGPILHQEKYITDWICTPFRSIIHTDTADSWFREDEKEALELDNNFIRLFSNNGSEKKICIDEIVNGPKKSRTQNIPVNVLNVDTDGTSFPEELFFAQEIKKPMVVVVNKELLLKTKIMDFLFKKLESLGSSFKANTCLQELKNAEEQQYTLLFNDLRKEIEDAWRSSYTHDCSSVHSIKLCFLDSSVCNQQTEYISNWVTRILKPHIFSESSWFFSDITCDLSNDDFIQITSSTGINTQLSIGNKNPRACILTILSVDGGEQFLELPKNIENPIVIIINKAELKNEKCIALLSEQLKALGDQYDAKKCLERLNKEIDTHKKISMPKNWLNISKIFANPVAQGITVVGISIAIIILLKNYFNQSIKSIS